MYGWLCGGDYIGDNEAYGDRDEHYNTKQPKHLKPDKQVNSKLVRLQQLEPPLVLRRE